MGKAKFFLISFVVFLFLIGITNAQNDSLSNPGLPAEGLPKAGISPDSPFYFFDKFGEWARMNFLTFGEKAKTRLKIKYAEERLAELEKISRKKDVSLNAINKAKERLNKFSEEAISGAQRLEKEGKKLPSDIEEKLNFLFQRQGDVLKKVLEQVPESAKPAISKVIEESQERFERKIEKRIEGKIEEKTENKEEQGIEIPKIKIETSQIKIEAVPLSKIREISIANGGFEPSKIEAEKGMIVRWFNRSNRESWPASAVHPTHNAYPQKGGCIGSAFDACHGIQPGEAYEFVFEESGTWGYHDHLNPSAQGVVIVK